MPRVSKEQASKNHDVIEGASARLFREQGFKAVTVNELMSAAGLTHGGFYRHFESKDALAKVACQKAFDQSRARIGARIGQAPDRPAALRSLVDGYLSIERRDNLGDGCAATAFASDISREPAESPLRAAYIDGVKGLLDQIGALSMADHSNERRDAAIVQLSAMVGALLLARATNGDELSEQFLSVVREHIVRAT
ncbi:TetR/AcrR family transcriptional regulator [Massilia cavernae]|uniref:TetR/AcrR family transcriptional regulator n=1 Tax=Massilia cavernae TaxID=2320864 RepID=A0A418X6Y4_9BURK|nr:TetR/AcrR family transcriptional regulator [Massilia cavernae]RJG08217.1 TetR/AcrR family transcriptional regulator [Massilia cavernae]